MIEVKGLTKYFGPVAAIEDVSFSVAKGEIIGFLGPNAAGKNSHGIAAANKPADG